MRERCTYDIKLPILSEYAFDSGLLLDMRCPRYVHTPFGLYHPHIVTTKSGKRIRKAVEQLALYFKREFGYDFVQYSAKETLHQDRAFLWSDSTPHNGRMQEVVYGACCFRWRKYKNHPHGWAMAWCWFHPYERRKGHLSDAWPYFQARFPGFTCEGPFSPAMTGFLLKVGYFTGDDREKAIKRLLGEKIIASNATVLTEENL